MKIAWICSYPIESLQNQGLVLQRSRPEHPYSWIVNLSRALAEHPDVELHLFMETQFVSRDQVIHAGNIHYHVLRQAIPLTTRGLPAWLPWGPVTGYRFRAWRLARKVRAIIPDVVHGHGTEGSNALAAHFSGYPVVCSIQGIISYYQQTNPCLYYWLTGFSERWLVRRERYFMCRTNYDTAFVHTLNPLAHIFNIPEAMHPVFFNHPNDEITKPSVLFVGSDGQRKGFALLVAALQKVVRTVPTLELDVVGNFSIVSRKYYSSLLAKSGLTEDQVRWHGFLTPQEIARLHRQCAVFVLSSTNENSPNTLAEAMCSGMAVVGFAVGGVPAMVNSGVDGLLVESGSIRDLAEAITGVLRDGVLRRKLALQARQAARRHWPSIVAEQTIEAYYVRLGIKS